MKEIHCPHCDEKLYGLVRIWDLTDMSKRYISGGSHAKLIEATRLMIEAQRLEEEVREEQRETQKTLRPIFKWTAKIETMTRPRFFTKVPEGAETITFFGTLANEDELKASLMYYGSFNGSFDTTKRSVLYYRKHGFLFHDSGGTLVLDDEQPCSDEEWEELKKCNFGKFSK